MCCYVIVTVRSLLWTLLSIFILLTELAAFMSAHWLVSSAKVNSGNNNTGTINSKHEEALYRTTGLFIRCQQKDPFEFLSVSENCRIYAHSIGSIASPFWVACCFFMALGILFLLMGALLSIISLCRRSLKKKSIFSISGILQAIAGLFLICALVLFPAGWGSNDVKYECGGTSSAFNPGLCTIAWAYYTAIFGTVLAFLCAGLSNQAEASMRADSVENDVIDGKNPVCGL